MTTTENNKLIAEFMGLDTVYLNKPMYLLKWKGNLVQKKDDTIFKFDSNWNWLMEVVEKIENLGFEFVIVESRCKILHNTDKSIEILMGFELVGKKINAVYYNCIEFIKWYNNQNQ